MLSALSSPSVCVIDDEQDDYEAILSVLNGCFISAVHLPGSLASLPPKPFDRLQLVFLDLHLNGAIGKDAASYTANFFRNTVSQTTAPLLVVIWSKYADDVPAGEEQTEAELFKQTLLGAAPDYNGRLIFVEMAKPKRDSRPEDWHDALRKEIERVLQGHPAIEVLWAWNERVKEGCTKISQDMTVMAQAAIAGSARALQDGLKATMQKLAKAQSEGDLVSATAPKYLFSVLSSLLLDQLENPTGISGIATHGNWLSENPAISVSTDFSGMMNAVLLTSEHSRGGASYAPGTVFRIIGEAGFRTAFDKDIADLLAVWMSSASSKWKEWQRSVQPVLIELSPVCDLAQGNRVNSLLVAGVVVPSAQASNLNKSGDAFGKLPANFYLRWPTANFVSQEVALGYCNRYKLTLPAGQVAEWLDPWFRLRELPLAAIRNANSAHASRVGFVSLSKNNA